MTKPTTPKNPPPLLSPQIALRNLQDLLKRLDRSIEILSASQLHVNDIVALAEEAGGLTVRARDTLKTKAGYEGNKDRLLELENRYKNVLARIDAKVETSQVLDVNLLKADRLITSFDLEGKITLETNGFDLTSKGLEFRPPNFSSLETVQDSRIDVMNAIDMAITLRHVITSDLILMQTRQEFSKEAIDNLPHENSNPSPLPDEVQKLDTASMTDEAAALLALQIRARLTEQEDTLASETHAQILRQF
jgi:hypothetical protein